MRRLVIALIVLGALVVAADRGAVFLAERAATDRVRAQGLTGAVVDIRGVPFLTQLAASALREVAVTGDAYSIDLGTQGAGPTELTHVRVVARDVVLGSRLDPSLGATAAQATVAAVVPYPAVSALAGSATEVMAATGDQVRVVQTVERFGRSIQVRATARISVSDGQILVRPTEASVAGAGPLDDIASDLLLPLVALRYPVPELPEDLVLTDVAPVAGGLAVTLTGHAVSLTELR